MNAREPLFLGLPFISIYRYTRTAQNPVMSDYMTDYHGRMEYLGEVTSKETRRRGGGGYFPGLTWIDSHLSVDVTRTGRLSGGPMTGGGRSDAAMRCTALRRCN